MFFFPLICSAHNQYKSNILKQISQSSGIYEVIDTLPDGVYNGIFLYKNRPIIICVNNNIIEHIGYSLFSDSVRCIINSPALNFVERYSLELELPIDTIWSKKNRMEIDNVKFKKGDFDFFKRLPNDSLYSFMLMVKEHKYVLKWENDRKVCCEIEFPMHYDLIGGRERIELENSLKIEIDQDLCLPNPKSLISLDMLEKDSLEGYYVLRRGNFYSKGLNSDQYYSLEGDSTIIPYYEKFHIVETLSNLFSIPGYNNNNLVLNIRMQKYGLNYDSFSVPVSRWVKYCLNQGCTPYFGIISIGEKGTLQCSLMMNNSRMAYLHAMKITLNYSVLDKMEGHMEAELSSYIMTSKIKKLFKEYEL